MYLAPPQKEAEDNRKRSPQVPTFLRSPSTSSDEELIEEVSETNYEQIQLTNDLSNNEVIEDQTRQLLDSVAEGNTREFWVLWDLYKRDLYHLCLWQMGGVREDTEDALSRAMLRALEKLPDSAGRIQNFKAWLSRLTINLCVDMHRERKRQVRRLENIENGLPEKAGSRLTEADSPEEGLIAREVFDYVCNAVEELPPRLREPFVLRFFQEMEYREIADRLILSTENVRKRIQQAREILREQLNETGALDYSGPIRRRASAHVTAF